jgi:hypothetical protein
MAEGAFSVKGRLRRDRTKQKPARTGNGQLGGNDLSPRPSIVEAHHGGHFEDPVLCVVAVVGEDPAI